MARVSLATVQNIEAGRANPAVGTLGRILDVLGMDLELRRRPVDWDLLVAMGVPLQQQGAANVRPTPELLARLLRSAVAELMQCPGVDVDQRKMEAVQATLCAAQRHFPTFYRRYFARNLLACALVRRKTTGRLVRQGRLAASRLAEYL